MTVFLVIENDPEGVLLRRYEAIRLHDGTHDVRATHEGAVFTPDLDRLPVMLDGLRCQPPAELRIGFEPTAAA